MTPAEFQALQDTLTLRGTEWYLYDDLLIAHVPLRGVKDESEIRFVSADATFTTALQQLTKEPLR